MFGLSLSEQVVEEVVEEDQTGPLTEEQTLALGSEFSHTYEKIVNYIERSESQFAKTHLAL
jgi:hypothetical protein